MSSPYENNAAATRSAVGAALAVACTPGANPGGRMLCAPTGFRWTVGAAISRPSLFPHGERTIPPIRGKCPEGTKGVGGHGEAVTDEGALLDRNPYSNGRAGEGTRPYGENRTVAVGSAEPGAVVEPQQRQFLQTQGPVARMEPQKTAQILRAGNFAQPRRYASPVMGVLGGGRHGGRSGFADPADCAHPIASFGSFSTWKRNPPRRAEPCPAAEAAKSSHRNKSLPRQFQGKLP